MSEGTSGSVLVVGASGRLGMRLTQSLLASGRSVRALMRPLNEAPALADGGAQLTYGDLCDRASLANACTGVDVVVACATAASRPPPDSLESVDIRGYANLIAAALGAGVQRFVYVSAFGADPASRNPLLAAKGETERRLAHSGLDVSVIAPVPFLDVWVPLIVTEPARRGEPVRIVGDADRPHAFVAAADVATAAVQHVTNGVSSRRVVVTGPEPLSWREIVRRTERELERAIAFEAMGFE